MPSVSLASESVPTMPANSQQWNEAVLVTGPRCVTVSSPDRQENAVVRVEPESFKYVDTSENMNKNPILRFLESSFVVLHGGSKNTSKEDIEMEEIVRTNSYSRNHQPSDIYDACREYSYSYKYTDENDEEDDDDDDQEDEDDDVYQHNDQLEVKHSCSSSQNEAATPLHRFRQLTQSRQSQACSRNDKIYLLGRQYHAVLDYDARRNDELSLFWFTYRCDFPSIDPYGITSDAGWGCMLRATQMLLAQALRLHYKGRDWRPLTAQFNQPASCRRSDPFIRSLLTWFADFPSSTTFSSSDSMYSLHNMVAVGLTKYDKLPGEWYGPGTACYVLRDLCQRHANQQELSIQFQQKNKTDATFGSGSFGSATRKMFRVHVASSEGAIYRDEIHQLMTADQKSAGSSHDQVVIVEHDKHSKPLPSHPLDASAWEDELVESLTHLRGREIVLWDTALLLLIPLRLGLRSFNSDYSNAVAFTFSLPQSVGILGGRPRGARWFFGALVNEGNESKQVFALDPHTVQTAPRRRNATVNGISKQIVELSEEYMRSVHSTFTETFSLDKIDPSIALGFYCRDHADLEHLFDSLLQYKKSHPKSPELFHVQDELPNYEQNDDMMMNDDSCDVENIPSVQRSYAANITHDDTSDDDDEFVFL